MHRIDHAVPTFSARRRFLGRPATFIGALACASASSVLAHERIIMMRTAGFRAGAPGRCDRPTVVVVRWVVGRRSGNRSVMAAAVICARRVPTAAARNWRRDGFDQFM